MYGGCVFVHAIVMALEYQIMTFSINILGELSTS